MERGLSELVMLCLGKPLDKTYQVSDWERRPLLAEQLVYAALDAYCLLEVYTVLHQWVKESRTYVNMEPELYLSSLGADKKKKSRNGNRMKHPKPGTLGMRLTAPVNTDNPISPRQLSIVVDTMLQGLGRNLRCCGVDVNILSTGTSHEDAAKVAIQENRILLTSGTPYYSLRSKVPEGMCLCVPVGTVKEQVVEIFRHFNVRVTSQDIFSRCQICNGNRYIQVIPDHMKLAHHIMKNPDLLDNIPLPVDCPIDYQTLTLKETGVPLKLGLLTDNAWKRKIDVFYCCAMCGKIFWEGSHFAKVQEQFAHLLYSS
ncbi:Exonuclease mut-7-like [Exaiptasia diaphana]|nr:Exonuclease mut-7-like [Exaiptasia diaphana]